MKRQLKNPYLYLMMLADAALLLLAHFSAYLLRFEFSLEPPFWAQFWAHWPWIIFLKLICFYYLGLYRGMWRYTSLVDLKKVFIAAVVSSLIVTAFVAFLFQFQGFPRSAFLIDFVLTLLFIGGLRVGVRMVLNPGSIMTEGLLGKDKDRKRIIVLGAGFTGEKVVREILDSPAMEMKPVAFLDDNRNKYGKSIHGVPVKGSIGEIGKLEDEFDEILIAIPSVKGEQMRGIVSALRENRKALPDYAQSHGTD